MKILLAALFAVATLSQALPASATTGYEVVYGISVPKDVRAGPFDTLAECNRFMNSNGWYYPYRCEMVTY